MHPQIKIQYAAAIGFGLVCGHFVGWFIFPPAPIIDNYIWSLAALALFGMIWYWAHQEN
jgi:hypothetical protein